MSKDFCLTTEQQGQLLDALGDQDSVQGFIKDVERNIGLLLSDRTHKWTPTDEQMDQAALAREANKRLARRARALAQILRDPDRDSHVAAYSRFTLHYLGGFDMRKNLQDLLSTLDKLELAAKTASRSALGRGEKRPDPDGDNIIGVLESAFVRHFPDIPLGLAPSRRGDEKGKARFLRVAEIVLSPALGIKPSSVRGRIRTHRKRGAKRS